eukprot:gnl/TRDRNA2_/TRDRNA2_199637_c0_seq1.p1 gnl/TRDRNA2_/TRDRNA2_199637_c0~~gnl/TRDRNA2_/TRDRNA2_199637_c0_seq1.p1  ORF type:complete len:184 (+),score=24.16 gnl/TRDRNA2_/TRDRNA2_199637_c0_seq1:93-644(+)
MSAMKVSLVCLVVLCLVTLWLVVLQIAQSENDKLLEIPHEKDVDQKKKQTEKEKRSPSLDPTLYYMVGSFSQWSVHSEPMGTSTNAGNLIVIQQDAPKLGVGDIRREEFQILGDGRWERRIFPAGGIGAAVVPLGPGEPSLAAGDDGQGGGHGRNWAVDGEPGTTFKILYDPEQKLVSCEVLE